MFHGKYVTIIEFQPIIEAKIGTTNVNVVDVNVATRNKAIKEQVIKDRKQRKAKSLVDWEKEEWLKKSMVEIIQQIKKTQTQPKGPSTFMEGWNTTCSNMPNITPTKA